MSGHDAQCSFLFQKHGINSASLPAVYARAHFPTSSPITWFLTSYKMVSSSFAALVLFLTNVSDGGGNSLVTSHLWVSAGARLL